MVDSGIKCDDITESHNKETNSDEKKTQNFYILLAFLSITVALIAVSIYCYLIKYRAKQKHLSSFQFTNSKLTEIIH